MGDVARHHPVTREYDNSTRRELAGATRNRIVDAAVELMRAAPIRNWEGITIGAVAERAGVSERTVYRHFGSDRGLRDAVMERVERLAGVDLATLTLDGVAAAATASLRFAAGSPGTPTEPIDPTLDDADRRRRDALARAVGERRAAAVIDLLWSLSAFERLQGAWDMDGDDALGAIEWAIDLVRKEVE